MTLKLLTLAAAALFATSGLAFAATNEPPGQAMHENGAAKSTAPGASEYAPGHVKKQHGDTNASKYAPGHSTTGSGDKDRDRDDKLKTEK